jgi:hypothetical protein
MVLDIQTVHHILKNTAVQNVNKPFVYITDLTSPLKVYILNYLQILFFVLNNLSLNNIYSVRMCWIPIFQIRVDPARFFWGDAG